jgi:hypothetical protein
LPTSTKKKLLLRFAPFSREITMPLSLVKFSSPAIRD